MKRRLMFLLLAAIGLASCNQFKTAPGGLVYDIVVDKPGPSIQPGDFVSINFTIKNDADSVVGSSYDQGTPSNQIMPKPRQKGDVIAGLLYLSEGDSAVLKTNIDSLTKGAPRAKGLKGKYMVYDIKIVKVIAKGNLNQQVFMGRCQAYVNTLSEASKKREPIMIKNYIASKNLKLTTTASGLNYVITQQGTGDKAAPGDTVSVYYTGMYLNGKVFDTNIKDVAQKNKLEINPMNPYKPIKFALGAQGMIQGWNEGIPLLSKGGKATFVIPSSLAYGERGYGPMGPYTPLAFDVELVDIKHPDPNAPKPPPPAPLQVHPMPGQATPTAKK